LNKGLYSGDYYNDYRSKGHFLKRERGERWHQYGYWLRYINRHYPGNCCVLELGCGLGYFAKVASRAHHYIGIDIALFPLQVARSKDPAINLIQGNALKLPFQSQSVDTVVAFDLLEHISDPGSSISEIYRVLRNNGRLIATTPNVKSLGNRLKSPTGKSVPSMYKDPTHVSLLDREEWERLFRGRGFEISRVATDTLWDIPYSSRLPVILQKSILVPFNISVSYIFGGLPWLLGENLIFVCKK